MLGKGKETRRWSQDADDASQEGTGDGGGAEWEREGEGGTNLTDVLWRDDPLTLFLPIVFWFLCFRRAYL